MLPGVKNGAWRGTFFVGPNVLGRLQLLLPLLFLLVLPLLTACDEDVTLVDPAPIFSFDPENAWATTCGPPGGPGKIASQPAPTPASVPPPPGLAISACPNPAPPGTPEITIEFRLDVRVPSVNLAIVNSSGQIVQVLLMDEAAPMGSTIRASWLLEGITPGDYRAYFLAGSLETSGDIQVQ